MRGRLTPRTISGAISDDLNFTAQSKRSAIVVYNLRSLSSDAQGSAHSWAAAKQAIPGMAEVVWSLAWASDAKRTLVA